VTTDKVFNAAIMKLQDIRDRVAAMQGEYSLMHLAEVNWLLGIACGLAFVVEADVQARRLTPAVPIRWVSWEFQLRDRLDALDQILDAAERTLFEDRPNGDLVARAMTQMLNAPDQSFGPPAGVPCSHPPPHMAGRCVYCGAAVPSPKTPKGIVEKDLEDPS
jgi:hypothetical protein